MSNLNQLKQMLDDTEKLMEAYGTIPVPKEFYNVKALLFERAIRAQCPAYIETEKRKLDTGKKNVSDLLFEKEKEGPLKKWVHITVLDTDYKLHDRYLIKVMNDDYDTLVLGRVKDRTADGQDAPEAQDTSDDIYSKIYDNDEREDPDSAGPFNEEVPAGIDMNKDNTEDDGYEDPYAGLDAVNDVPVIHTEPEKPKTEGRPQQPASPSGSAFMEKAKKKTEQAPAIKESVKKPSKPKTAVPPETPKDAPSGYVDIDNRLPVFAQYPELPKDKSGRKSAGTFLYDMHKIKVRAAKTKEYTFCIYPLKIEENALVTDVFVVASVNDKYIRAGISRGRTSAVTITFDETFLVRGSWKNGIFESQITVMGTDAGTVEDELIANNTRRQKTATTYVSIPTSGTEEIYIFPGIYNKNDEDTGYALAAMAIKTKDDVMVLTPTQEGIFAINNGKIKLECYWQGNEFRYDVRN